MAVPIAELFVSVSADVNAAVSGLNALQNKLSGTTSAFQQAAPAALLLAGAGAAIGAGFVGAINVAADFEHQMSAVKSVLSPAEVEQFGVALDQLALKLGRDTVFTSRQAAAAIEELVKAGVPVADVLNGGAAAALNLAAATGVTTSEAATIASQALNTFKLSGDQATAVVDRLAAVANASASDISFLRFGMAATGGVAASLGLSFDDEAVALGILSRSFANGSDAGTSFKTFMQRLQPQTKAQIKEFDKLGITTAGTNNQFFDAAGHVKDLSSIAGTLRTALSGLNDEQRLSALQTLFGTDAVRAAIAIYGAGADGVTNFKDQTGQSGVAADSAKTRMDNLSGALQNLGGSFETVQIIVGNFFLPILKAIALAVKGPLDAFSTMSPAAQAAATAIIGVAGAVASLIGGVVLLAPIVATIGPAFGALGVALAALAPFILVAVAIVGLLVAAWQSDLGGIQGLVSSAFDRIPSILEAVSGAFDAAGSVWANTILPAFQNIVNVIERKVIPVFNTLASGPLGNLALVFQKAFSGDIAGAVDTFIAIIGALVPGLGGIIQDVRSTMGNIAKFLGPILRNLGTVFEKVFAGDIGGALDTFRAIIGAALPDVGKFITGAFDLAAAVGKILGPAFNTVGTFLQTEVLPRLQALVLVLPALQAASSVLATFWETRLGPALQAVGAFIATEVAPRLQAFADAAIPALLSASQQLQSFWNTQLGPAAEAVGNFIAQNVAPAFLGLAAALGAAKDLGGAIFGTIAAQAASLGPFISSLANFFGALFSVMTALATIGGTALQGLFQNVLVPGFQALGGALEPAAPAFKAVADTLGPMVTNLGLIGDKVEPLKKFFDDATTALQDFAVAIQNFKLPPWLTPGSGVGLPGLPGPQGTPPVPGPTGFDPGAFFRPGAPVVGPGGLFHPTAFGGQGGGGPLVSIGQLIISSEAEAQAFLAQMAEVIRAAAGRVNAPPDNSGFPQLNTGVI